jgi:ParB-like chromosome segregation protein Spo0J
MRPENEMPASKKHASIKPTESTVFDFQAQEVRVDRLLLDPNNYRFLDRRKFKKKAATRFHEETVQTATLESLEQAYQLDELKQSILTNGYVPMERIIIVPYKPRTGYYLVVEGNRRVAALKSLLRDRSEGAITLSQKQVLSFSKIPCAVLTGTGTSLKHAERVIMGIRHIAGPKEWGAYQQAILVSELKDDEALEFAQIAEMLGTSSIEASRRYRAIGALKAMEADEHYAKKAEPKFYRLFHEMVSLPDVRERFGWSTETNAFIDTEKARLFFDLISPDGKHDAKLQTFGDVRKLKFVIGNNKAEDLLFDSSKQYSEAVKIGEQGKNTVNASGLLTEVRESISQIGFLQAKTLKAKDVQVISELLEMLTALKEITAKS